jgi:AraC-like DNA-binding protein
MRFLRHEPSPALTPWIEHLWCLSDAPAHALEHILPMGTLELVINLHEDQFRIYPSSELATCARFPGAMVSGAYRRYFVIDTRVHASILGVHFRPGGAVPFLGSPAGLLADTHVALEALWGPDARELRERLCAKDSAAQRFQLLEQALLKRLARPFRPWPAASFALESLRRGCSVRGLAAELGLSERRLITLFTRYIGLTPKLFARIERFQCALALVQSNEDREWSALALDAGYYDQSHMIREFVAFTGFSPGALRRQQGPDVKDQHVAVLAPRPSLSSNTRRAHARKLRQTI